MFSYSNHFNQNLFMLNTENSIKGLVAQSVECTLCKRKVEGSKPFWSKNPYKEVSIFLYGNVIQWLVYFVVAEKTRFPKARLLCDSRHFLFDIVQQFLLRHFLWLKLFDISIIWDHSLVVEFALWVR